MRRGQGLILLVVLAAVGYGGLALARSGSTPHRAPEHRVRRQRTYSSCPARDTEPVVSLAPGASAEMVPGAPAQLLLCRYSGFGAYPHPVGTWGFHLLAHHLAARAGTVRSLADRFNALPPVVGTRSCPNDTGQALIVVFRYASAAQADDPVTVHLAGCRQADNGHLVRDADPALLQSLLTLAPVSRPHSEPYRLYTHCGIEWTLIRGTYWRASHRLSDGQGNPPPGWSNPYQHGTLTFTGPSTAVFRASPGAVTFHRTPRTRPPVVCS